MRPVRHGFWVCALITLNAACSAQGGDNGTEAGDGTDAGLDSGQTTSHEGGDTGNDASNDALNDSGRDGATPDGSTQADAGIIPCGNQTCDAKSQVCCQANSTVSCTATTQCNGLAFPCTDTSGCTDDKVCCARLTRGDGGPTDLGYVVSCQWQCPLSQGFQLCTSDSECRTGHCAPDFGGLHTCHVSGEP
jgi:hypothetical protein